MQKYSTLFGANLICSVGYEFRGKREGGRCSGVLERGLEELILLIAALFVELTVIRHIDLKKNIVSILRFIHWIYLARIMKRFVDLPTVEGAVKKFSYMWYAVVVKSFPPFGCYLGGPPLVYYIPLLFTTTTLFFFILRLLRPNIQEVGVCQGWKNFRNRKLTIIIIITNFCPRVNKIQ